MARSLSQSDESCKATDEGQCGLVVAAGGTGEGGNWSWSCRGGSVRGDNRAAGTCLRLTIHDLCDGTDL